MSSGNNNYQPDIIETIGYAVLIVIGVGLIIIAGAPVVILAFIAQRLLKRYIETRWRVLIWLVPGAITAYILYTLWQHGLDAMTLKAGLDYTDVIKHYQANFTHWPWARLWSETWPLWIRTILALPFVALLFECLDKGRDAISAHALAKQLNKQLRSNTRYQRSARKKAGKPQHIPHSAGGMMVMGVPIKRKKQP
jgi:hypothetical protein